MRAICSAKRLRPVVVEHQLGHLVGHRRQQLVALLEREFTLVGDVAQQDLDVHLVVAGVDPRRVVDGIGVDEPAAEWRTPPVPSWVTPRLPPSATIRQRSSLPFTRNASLARSPTWELSSVDAFTYVPMPPFHSRSTGAFKIAEMSSVGDKLLGR